MDTFGPVFENANYEKINEYCQTECHKNVNKLCIFLNTTGHGFGVVRRYKMLRVLRDSIKTLFRESTRCLKKIERQASAVNKQIPVGSFFYAVIIENFTNQTSLISKYLTQRRTKNKHKIIEDRFMYSILKDITKEAVELKDVLKELSREHKGLEDLAKKRDLFSELSAKLDKALEIINEELDTLIETTEYDRITFFNTTKKREDSRGLDAGISDRIKETNKSIKLYRAEDVLS